MIQFALVSFPITLLTGVGFLPLFGIFLSAFKCNAVGTLLAVDPSIACRSTDHIVAMVFAGSSPALRVVVA